MKPAARIVAVLTLTLAVLAGQTAHAVPIPGSNCDGSGQLINGLGSTLQDTLHQRVFIPEYEDRCAAGAGQVRHLRVGEDAALQALQNHDEFYPLMTVDRPLTLSEAVLAGNDLPARRGRFSFIIHLPLFITPTVLAYNAPCPGLPRLKLSSLALSLIFSGTVLSWDHPLLVRDNPALAGCATAVKLATRVDAAATTRVFKDYMSKRNPQWNAFNQPQTVTQWPALAVINCLGLGDEGMAACVAKSPGYIGYLSFATLQLYPGLRVAEVENGSRTFVAPTLGSCQQAAQDAYDRGLIPENASADPRDPSAGDWSAVTLADSSVGYPVCNISYAIEYAFLVSGYFGLLSPGKMRTLHDYLAVTVSNAVQPRIAARGYAPLPADILRISQQGVDDLEFF